MVRRLLVPVVVLAALTGCRSAAGPSIDGDREPAGSGLSDAEVARAETAAREQLRDEHATVTDAWVRATTGTVTTSSNVGEPCTSGRLLKVSVTGSFPNIVTTGSPGSDPTVRALLLTIDATSGRPCLLGVATTVRAPGSRAVPLDLRSR